MSGREKEVEERISKERDDAATSTVARHPLSRETSRQANTRADHPLSRETSRQSTTRGPPPRKSSSPPASATVRPAFSFANAAKKAAEPKEGKEGQPQSPKEDNAKNSSAPEQVTEKAARTAV